MKFINFEDYKQQRDALINEAQTHLTNGDMDAYKAAVTSVENMDTAYEQIAQERANLTALQGAVNPPAIGTMGTVNVGQTQTDGDMEYRKAFMNYVMTGTPIQMTNADANTMTEDVGAVIPNTIMNRIVEKMEKAGNILARVTPTYYKGGVTVPTSSAKPTATWTTESGTTDKQKKPTGSIVFSYYKLKVQVSVSIMVANVTMDIFESTLANNISEAIIKALETAIIKGTGIGQPKGVLAEEPIADQVVSITVGNKITWDILCEAEGKLPAAYDNAVWCMNKKTFMSQIWGMVDTTGQPIARVNAGTSGKPEYSILGRPVEFSEDVKAFVINIDAEDTVAFIFRFEDYMLNTNMNVTITRYTDHDTDDEITKAIMLADGKVIDKNSLVVLKGKN